ncbi:MAG: hypothetical protein AAGA77_14110 [Bacteroidota bacterium]
MKIIFSIVLMLATPYLLEAQYFLGFHSEYDDTFREWNIVLEKDSTEIEGELELTWGINNDFTQWQYRVGDRYGEIYLKFKNNPGLWELAADDKVVTINQVWPGDVTEWKISHAGRSFVFRTTYPNILDEWAIKGNKHGELVIYTEYTGDARDWIVSDYTVEEITFEERMAALFIALQVSTPKF